MINVEGTISRRGYLAQIPSLVSATILQVITWATRRVA